MAERKLVDIDQAQTYTAPNGAQYRLRPNSSGLLLNGGTEDNPATTEAPATDAVAIWKASEYDGSSQFLTDQSGNGHHLRFGSQFPAYIAKGALNLPGVNGNYASTPDSAAVSITGDIDVRAHIAPIDWTPSSSMHIVCKRQSSSAYALVLRPMGKLSLIWWDSGNTGHTSSAECDSSIAPTISDGTNLWVRATLDVDNGASGHDVKFYTSSDGNNWTQLGTTITTASTTSIRDTANHVGIGGDSGVGSELFNGLIYYAEIRNGIDGPVAAKFDPSEVADFTTSFTSITGETWTINRPGGNIVDGGVRGANGATVPYAADMQFGSTISIEAKIMLDAWVPPSAFIVGGNYMNSTSGYRLYIDTAGKPVFQWKYSSGVNTVTCSAATGVADGTQKWVRATYNGSARVRFWLSDDGVSWTQLGSDGTAGAGAPAVASTVPFAMAYDYNQGSGYTGGTVYKCRAYGVDRESDTSTAAVLDVDFTNQDAYVKSFTCATGQTVTLQGQTGSDSNDPKFLAAEDSHYLYLPGVTGNYASMPDHPAVDITGDIDIRVKVALDDWTPGTTQQLLTKSFGGQQSFLFDVTTDGKLRLEWTTDGSTWTTKLSSVPTGLTDGSVKWVRVTADVDNGSSGNDIKFYLSDNGLSWTQLGSTVTTAGITSFWSGTANIEVGARSNGTNEQAAGKFYRAIIKDGINGTTVYDVDFAEAESESTTIENGIFPVPANRTTFTRASTAYLDGVEVASGVPRYSSGINLLTLNQSSVESDTTGFSTSNNVSISQSTEEAAEGNCSLKMTSQGAGQVLARTNTLTTPVIAGKTYTAIASYKAVIQGRTARTGIRFYDSSDTGLGTATFGSSESIATGGWTEASVTTVAPANSAWAVVWFAIDVATAAGEIYYIDKIQLTEGTVTEWRPGGPSAILIEEGTTNLLTAATSSFEDGSTGSWAANVGSPTLENSTTKAWTGTRSLLLTPTSAVTSNQLAYSPKVTATASTGYTASLWIYSNTPIAGAYIGINFTNGATYLGQSSATPLAVPAGVWTRLTHTATTTSTTDGVAMTLNGTFASGQGIYIDGAQIEQKGHATSWQIGGGTRAGEGITIPASSGLVPFNEGSMEVIFKPGTGWAPNTNGGIDGYYRVIGHSTAVNTNEIQIVRVHDQSAVAYSVWDNAGVTNGAIIGTTSVTIGAFVYVCLTWDSSNFKFYVNGVLQNTTPITNRPSVHGTLGIGTHPNIDRRLNGELDMVRLSRAARTQAEVTAVAAAMKFEADDKTTLFQDYRSSLAGEYSAVTTINRSASGRKSVVVDRELFLLGTDDYLEAPDHDELDFGEIDSFTAVIVLRGHSLGSATLTVMAKRNGYTPSNIGWLLFHSSGFRASIADGVNETEHGVGPLATSNAQVVVMRTNRSTETMQVTDGDSSSLSLSTAAVGPLENPYSLTIGRQTTGNYGDFEFLGAAIWRRALTDEEIGYLAGEFGVDDD